MRESTLQTGISLPALRTQSGTSPIDPGSTDVAVAMTRTRVVSGKDTVHQQDLVLPTGDSEGDTVTYTWTFDCERHSGAWTSTGGQWVVTPFSMTALPECGTAGIGP